MSLAGLLAACGGGGGSGGGGGGGVPTEPTYAVIGMVTGLSSGATVTLLNNGGDALKANSLQTFEFPTQLTSGASYNVTVDPNTPSGFICNVINGSGTVGQNDVTNVEVNCLPKEYVYVPDGTSGGVSAFVLDQHTGLLSPVASKPYAAGNNPTSVAVTPNGEFAYVGNAGGSSISEYRIEPETGALQPLSASSLPLAGSPTGMVMGHGGQFLYAVQMTYSTYSGRIFVEKIDPTTGLLTQITGSPFDTPTATMAIAVHPDGGLLYALADYNGNSLLYGYTIDPVTGVVHAMGTTALQTMSSVGSQTLTIDPTGRFLAVPTDDGKVHVYNIDTATGGLTEVTGSPFTAGNRPHGIAFNLSGLFAYVTNENGANISAYSVNKLSGALTPLPGKAASASAGTTPWIGAVEPTGSYYYVINNGSSNIFEYSIDPVTGALSNIGSVATGKGPQNIAIARP